MEKRNPNRVEKPEDSSGVTSRMSDATSKETVSDLEETAKISDSRSDADNHPSVPSPDGQDDGKRGERDDAGPM